MSDQVNKLQAVPAGTKTRKKKRIMITESTEVCTAGYGGKNERINESKID
jgi:hypothetical protein